jgi:hypothetical protein
VLAKKSGVTKKIWCARQKKKRAPSYGPMPKGKRKKASIEPSIESVTLDGQEYKVAHAKNQPEIRVAWINNESHVTACLNADAIHVKKVYLQTNPQLTLSASFQASPLECTAIQIEGNQIKDIVFKDDGGAISMVYNDVPVIFLNPPYADDEKDISAHERGYLVRYYGTHPCAGMNFLYDKEGKEICNEFDIATFCMVKRSANNGQG